MSSSVVLIASSLTDGPRACQLSGQLKGISHPRWAKPCHTEAPQNGVNTGKPWGDKPLVPLLKALHRWVARAGVNLMTLSLFCPDKIKMHPMTLAHFGPALA